MEAKPLVMRQMSKYSLQDEHRLPSLLMSYRNTIDLCLCPVQSQELALVVWAFQSQSEQLENLEISRRIRSSESIETFEISKHPRCAVINVEPCQRVHSLRFFMLFQVVGVDCTQSQLCWVGELLKNCGEGVACGSKRIKMIKTYKNCNQFTVGLTYWKGMFRGLLRSSPLKRSVYTWLCVHILAYERTRMHTCVQKRHQDCHDSLLLA